jgi:cytochrome c-type biogenesis protein CcmF
MSLLGAFLVRSGVLNSVHAFANDPARGVFILALLMAYVAGALALFAWRAPKLGGYAPSGPAHRTPLGTTDGLVRNNKTSANR